MANPGGKARNLARRKRLNEERRILKHVSKHIEHVVPLSECEYCAAASSGSSSGGQGPRPKVRLLDGKIGGNHTLGFDKYGYPLKVATISITRDNQGTGTERDVGENLDKQREAVEEIVHAEGPTQAFRLMDLPAELRLVIYEYAFATSRDVVCIRDDILRPTAMFDASSSYVLHVCTPHVSCFPCLLHYELHTMGDSGLSQASRQLHAETSPVPFTITTFSAHNLYYLFAFLKMIGPDARKAVRSLRFDWKLPEEDAHALGMYTDVDATWQLLDECTNLKFLEVDMHVLNLLSWQADGDERSFHFDYLQQIPAMERLLVPRGLEHVKFAWETPKSFYGLEDWIRVVLQVWALPRGAKMRFDPVPADVEVIGDGTWKRMSWTTPDHVKSAKKDVKVS